MKKIWFERSMNYRGEGGLAINILLTAFRGTSSEVLVKSASYKSLILPNHKINDSQFLLEELIRHRYDYVISFGQKPNIKNKVYIETTARNRDNCINTNFNYSKLKSVLKSYGISVQTSSNAGTSFCNALYWNGLHYIYNTHLDTKMIFLHIPFCKNISDWELFL